jgi:hypothetical protein
VKDMWSDPAFRRSWCSAVDYKDPASYHGSECFKGIEADCGSFRHHGKPASPGRPQHETMHLQGGGDGLNMNIFGCHSAQVFGLRCEDLHPDDSYRRMAWRIVLVVEGPRECTNLNSALRLVVDEFVQYSPTGTPFPLPGYVVCFSVKTNREDMWRRR